jgi:hypothetical protein
VDLEELRGLNFVREYILSEKSSYPIEKKRELLEMLHTSYLEVT